MGRFVWVFSSETKGRWGAQDRPKMPLTAILGSLGAVFGYLRVDLWVDLRVGDPKIDLKMAHFFGRGAQTGQGHVHAEFSLGARKFRNV